MDSELDSHFIKLFGIEVEYVDIIGSIAVVVSFLDLVLNLFDYLYHHEDCEQIFFLFVTVLGLHKLSQQHLGLIGTDWGFLITWLLTKPWRRVSWLLDFLLSALNTLWAYEHLLFCRFEDSSFGAFDERAFNDILTWIYSWFVSWLVLCRSHFLVCNKFCLSGFKFKFKLFDVLSQCFDFWEVSFVFVFLVDFCLQTLYFLLELNVSVHKLGLLSEIHKSYFSLLLPFSLLNVELFYLCFKFIHFFLIYAIIFSGCFL